MFHLPRFLAGQWLLMRPHAEAISFSRYTDAGWQAVDASALPQPSRFSRQVLLLPDHQCVFRNRSFPLELLVSDDLDEAVMLDMESWNPFHEPCDHLFFAQREKDCWVVAVWVWPQRVITAYLEMLPESLSCTHIMPELAWVSASLHCAVPALLIQAEQQYQVYTLISTAGLPLSRAETHGEADARRFCRGICGDMNGHASSDLETAAVFVVGAAKPFWLSEKAQAMGDTLPHAELLAQGRLPGVTDWTDPLAWKRPILTLLMMVLVWVMGDAAVLSLRAQSVDAAFTSAKVAASQVVGVRDQVESVHARLLQIQSLQHRQARPEQLLARLGEAIPKDIWITNIQLKGQWVDIAGQGKDVARLNVLLESVKGVKQVLLRGAVRPDARTGLEIFNVRLMLAEEDGA